VSTERSAHLRELSKEAQVAIAEGVASELERMDIVGAYSDVETGALTVVPRMELRWFDVTVSLQGP
jgi:hypothetical protein